MTSFATLAASLSTSSHPSSSTQAAEHPWDPVAQAKRQYIRSLHRVIEQSDVIILVLDARDPDGCRSKIVEEEVKRREGDNKKLIFVLNKIDLVPQDNAAAWLRYLRHTAPAVPFRCSTQQQSKNLTSRSSPDLLRLIKSYKSGPGSKITVGVVGYPNVGKSSLINSLKRSKVCAIAAEAGCTRDLQSVQIDRGVRIIDSPGVVFDDDDPSIAQARSGVLLRNVLKAEDVDDPMGIVEEIVARTAKEALQRIYKLPDWTSMLEFLTMLALSTGRLLKGGTPDLLSTARVVLRDWNANKIPYFSVPPVVHPSSLPSNAPGAENVGEAMIVKGGFSAAFNLGELYGEAMQQDQNVQNGHDNAIHRNTTEMESEDLHPVIRRKRSLSLTPDLDSVLATPTASALGKRPSDAGGQMLRGSMAKRSKPTYDTVLDSHERRTMGLANPLGRKAMRQKSKKERKAARRVTKAQGEAMVLDDVGEAAGFAFVGSET